MATTSMTVSRPELKRMAARAQALAARAKSAMAKAERAVETGIRSVEVGASAFALGMAEGRFGAIDIVGVPMPLMAAAAAHTMGFLSSDKISDHLHALGDGALASYCASAGFRIGKTWAAKAGSPGAATKGESLSDDDAADMALR